jgi:hypothetical protein
VSWVQLQMPSGCRIHAFSKVSFSSSILNCFPFTADGLLHSLLYSSPVSISVYNSSARAQRRGQRSSVGLNASMASLSQQVYV